MVLRKINLQLVLQSVLGVLTLVAIITLSAVMPVGASGISVNDLLAETNQARAANGKGPLTLDGRLNTAGNNKAYDMFEKQYWAHNDPNGKTPWHFVTEAGYSYTYAGENLARGFTTSSATVDAWMNSSGHRANILSGSYADVGFGVVNGTLEGEQTTLVVAFYGAQSTSSPSPPVAKPDTSPSQSEPEPIVPTPQIEPEQESNELKAETEPKEPEPGTPAEELEVRKQESLKDEAEASSESIPANEMIDESADSVTATQTITAAGFTGLTAYGAFSALASQHSAMHIARLSGGKPRA